MTAVLDRPALGGPALGPSGSVALAPYPDDVESPGAVARPAPARPRPARMAPPRIRSAALPVATVAVGSRPLRLTRRARLLCTLSVLSAALLVSGVAAANSDASAPAPVTSGTVVVGPGDTLWQLATDIAPDADTADVVAQLRDLNDLGSAPLQPGQVLAVPGL